MIRIVLFPIQKFPGFWRRALSVSSFFFYFLFPDCIVESDALRTAKSVPFLCKGRLDCCSENQPCYLGDGHCKSHKECRKVRCETGCFDVRIFKGNSIFHLNLELLTKDSPTVDILVHNGPNFAPST